MTNRGQLDFLKPTTITGQQYGTRITVEIDHSDTDIDELFDAFQTICIGLGYHESTLKQWVLDRADEYRDEEFDKNYSFDFPESFIDEALAEHNADEDSEYGNLYHSTDVNPWGVEEEPSQKFESDNFEDYQNDDLEFPAPNEKLKNAAKEYKKSVKVGRRGVKKSK
jgi:hypothetical protein